MSEHQMKELLPQKSSRKPQAAEQATPSKAEGTNDELIRLQRLVGNHAVKRMLADNAVSIQQRTAPTIQAKMTVGAADDAYEQEADAVASQVMTKRDVVQRKSAEEEVQMKRIDTIQRESEGGEEEDEQIQAKRVDTIQRESEGGEEEEEQIQAKRIDTIQRESEGGEEEDEQIQAKRVDVQRKPVDMSGSFDVEQDVESKISAKSGGGQAIPEVSRNMFESTMGHDFSGVNVHTDSESDGLNQQLGARAFTTGSDIFFRQGEYNPESSGGQQLLAHELTHVVQQGGAGVKKKAEEE